MAADADRSSFRTVFEALGEDDLGYISAERFSDLAKDFGVESNEELHNLLSLLDPLQTGKISFESFYQGIHSVIVKDTTTTVKDPVNTRSPDVWIDKTIKTDDDDLISIDTSESTYNEYDDSAFTDMSEDNTPPLLYDSMNPLTDGEDTDSAIMLNMNGVMSEPTRIPQVNVSSDDASLSLPSDSEQRFEDFGQNSSGLEFEIQEASSLSDSVETIERQTPSSLLNGSLQLLTSRSRPIMMKRDVWAQVRRMKCPVKRISSKEFANHLYRSSSSNNLQSKGAIDGGYGDYAASDTDVLELNDKVLELESQVIVLEEEQASRVGHQGRLKDEKTMLLQQILSSEEQLREAEMRHQAAEEAMTKEHREHLARIEKDMDDRLELLTNRMLVLGEEKTQYETEVSRLKMQMDHLKQENARLQEQVLDVDNKWLALSVEYQQKQDHYHRERRELKETIKASGVLVDDLSREVDDLRRENLDQREQRARLLRSPSISDLPSRYTELTDELHRVKKENTNLKEFNDILNVQMLHNSVDMGRSLLHRGTSKSVSFAAEMEKSSKDDIMQALREEEQLNRDLREYIGCILSRILESNPGLLEIRPKRHGSVASLISMDT